MNTKKTILKIASNMHPALKTMSAIASPIADVAVDSVKKGVEKRKDMVIMPKLYSPEYRTTSEQAVEILNSLGLKAILSPTIISDADPIYRNCINNQVIKSDPKAKQKVKPGASVRVLYITQEVIDESQRLFNESEEQKKQAIHEKSINRSEQKEKAKKVVIDVSDNFKHIIKKASTVINDKKNSEDAE